MQRPVSVVKELLENSLDAGATHIVVHVEKGGLSKLSITDNGSGIAKRDLPLLATRHATSKLTSVDDFATLQTFGFRGEAIASTSMVSRLLTVTTRTADSSVAYTQSYQNGKPSTQNAKPCARTVGTTLVVQDLFYNVPHRQKVHPIDPDSIGFINFTIMEMFLTYTYLPILFIRLIRNGRVRSTPKSWPSYNTMLFTILPLVSYVNALGPVSSRPPNAPTSTLQCW